MRTTMLGPNFLGRPYSELLSITGYTYIYIYIDKLTSVSKYINLKFVLFFIDRNCCQTITVTV